MNVFFSVDTSLSAKVGDTIEQIWRIMSKRLIFFTGIIFYLVKDGFIVSYF